MESDIRQMYMDLTELLQDICEFLTSDKLGKLSLKDKSLVETLINRSKKQLQEISKNQPFDECGEEYVIMDKKGDFDIKLPPEITEVIYPVIENLPANDASRNIKYGYISMKRQFLLGFERMRRVYASIHDDWLIIYCTERDSKPLCAFHLKNYEAKECSGGKGIYFELIGVISDRKVYQFMAITRKDMVQWVVQINRCHDKTLLTSKSIDQSEPCNIPKPLIPSDEDSDNEYCVIKSSNNFTKHVQNEDAQLMYDVVKYTSPNDSNNKQTSAKSTLPRRPFGKLPLPVTPPSQHTSNESLASYHDIDPQIVSNSHTNSTKSLDESFSEDDEERIYEVFAGCRTKINKLNNEAVENEVRLPQQNKVALVPPIPTKPKVAQKPSDGKNASLEQKSVRNNNSEA